MCTQLETFFRDPVVRQSKLQMDHVFKTTLGGAPLIDVRERVVGADPLSECLAMHGRALGALEKADLELSAKQEGGRQHAAALRARAQQDSTVHTVAADGTLTYLNPARVAGHPAKQARQGIAYDEEGQRRARARLHFWAGSMNRNRLSAASGCHAFGYNVDDFWWEYFLCDRKVDQHELSRAWRRPCLGLPAAAEPGASRPFAASASSTTAVGARNGASSSSRRARTGAPPSSSSGARNGAHPSARP